MKLNALNCKCSYKFKSLASIMSMVNKVLICLCCSECACWFATFQDEWAGMEACLLCCAQCAGCCWAICAPIPHSLKCGDFGKGVEHLKKAVFYGVYGCLVSCIAPIDGIINCVLYNMKNCKSGVSGVGDITENCKFIAKKIESALDAKGSNEPESTFKSFSP